jgi:CBS domain-containing protein
MIDVFPASGARSGRTASWALYSFPATAGFGGQIGWITPVGDSSTRIGYTETSDRPVSAGGVSVTVETRELPMPTIREIMTAGAVCVGENESLADAARKMRELDVGALPVCGEDNRLKGMVTDRDIVVRCIADDGDPRTTRAGDLAQGKPVTIGADDSVEEALNTMKEHQVRRLPVIDGHDLVGIVSQADVARHLEASRVGEVVEAISEPDKS